MPRVTLVLTKVRRGGDAGHFTKDYWGWGFFFILRIIAKAGKKVKTILL